MTAFYPARAPIDATAQELTDLASIEARVLGLEEPQAVAAGEVAHRVFTHPLLGRARAAAARAALRRETPVTCRLPDGTLLEGVVDLAFEEEGRWHVVDFKTDREIDEAGEAQYRRQVALYAAAITQATGLPSDATIVRA